MKKIINISIWSTLTIALFVLIVFIYEKQKNIKCKKISIYIDSQNAKFVAKEDIKSMIYQMQGNIIKKHLSDINIKQIEKKINQNPYIDKADAYSNINGTVKIDVTQRKPIMRIINNRGESFYLDNYGHKMPLNNKYTARVIIASGNIKKQSYPHLTDKKYPPQANKKDSTLIRQSEIYKLYSLAKYIHSSEFWQAQISQIYINKSDEIEFIPYIGNHIVIFGDIDNMKEKFENLFAFYKQEFNNIARNKYKSINLKYKNQIICSKF